MPTKSKVDFVCKEDQRASDGLLHHHYTRRNLLTRAALTGVMSIGLLSITACGGARDEDNERNTQVAAQSSDEDQQVCTDSEELSNQAIASRKALNYVDQATDPERICSNCQFFQKPESNAACGGCQIVNGPIAPGGYCNAWVTRG